MLHFLEKVTTSYLKLGKLIVYLKFIFRKPFYIPENKHVPKNYLKLQNSSFFLINCLEEKINILKKNFVNNISVLDMCCASGRHLKALQKTFGNKVDYYGFEINEKNKFYTEKYFPKLFLNSSIKYCDIREFYNKNRLKYSISFTHGRSIDLVEPDFDLIKSICDTTEYYVILCNLSNKSKSSYFRFWDYEFDRNGFKLLKHFEPESSYCEIPKGQEDRDFFSKIYIRKSIRGSKNFNKLKELV